MTPPKEDGPHVVVTLESIYTLALETRSDVAEIKTTVIQLVKQDEDHERRIRELEQARWKIAGIGGALGLIAGLIPTLITLFAR